MSEPLVITVPDWFTPEHERLFRAAWNVTYYRDVLQPVLLSKEFAVVRPIVAPRQRTRPPLHVAPRDKSRAYRARRNVRTAQGET